MAHCALHWLFISPPCLSYGGKKECETQSEREKEKSSWHTFTDTTQAKSEASTNIALKPVRP